MKLYFYILDADSSNPKGLYVKDLLRAIDD